MITALSSFKYRNLFGNILAGGLFIATGLCRMLEVADPLAAVVSLASIAAILTSIIGNASRKRERADELYWANAGRAAYYSLLVDAFLLLSFAGVGLFTHASIDLCGAAFTALGITYLAFGIAFACLEGGYVNADD